MPHNVIITTRHRHRTTRQLLRTIDGLLEKRLTGFCGFLMLSYANGSAALMTALPGTIDAHVFALPYRKRRAAAMVK